MNNTLSKTNKRNIKNNSGTIEDIKESVGILEKLAGIFISIFSIFKSKKK